MLGDLLRSLLGMDGGVAKPATQAAKKAGQGVARSIGGAGKMNPNNTPVGKAMQMQPMRQMKMRPKMPELEKMQYRMPYGQGTSDFTPDSLMGQGSPIGNEFVPNNYTAGRTGYYQGSNPYLNNIDDLDYKLRVR